MASMTCDMNLIGMKYAFENRRSQNRHRLVRLLRQGAVIPIGKPHPESGRMASLVMGHEYSGVVVETASDVTNVKPGDRVAMECIRHCGHCPWCKRGKICFLPVPGFHWAA